MAQINNEASVFPSSIRTPLTIKPSKTVWAGKFYEQPEFIRIFLVVILLSVISASVFSVQKITSNAHATATAQARSSATAIAAIYYSQTLTAQPTATITPTLTPTATSTPTLTPTRTPTAEPTSPAPMITWKIQVVDQGPSVGIFTSLATSSGKDQFIAYLDDRNDNLKLANLRNSVWSSRSLMAKSPNRYGFYPSIALDTRGNPCISYYAFSAHQIFFGCVTSSGSWSSDIVARNIQAADTSLVIDSENNPHIAYFDKEDNFLKYATNDGSGWTFNDIARASAESVYYSLAIDKNGELHTVFFDGSDLVYATLLGNRWETQVIQSGQSSYPAIVFNKQGAPEVSFYDSNQGVLKHATLKNGAWQITIVDQNGNVGKFSSITIDKQQNIHISYYDETNSALKYAIRQGPSWHTYTVNNNGDVGMWNSIVVDQDGNPCISYYDSSSQVLEYAYGKISR